MPIPFSNNNRLVIDKLDVIARTMAVPNEHSPIRLPVASGEERTAVTALQTTGTYNFSIHSGSDMYALLFRHSAIPFWIETIVIPKFGYPSNIFPIQQFNNPYINAPFQLSTSGPAVDTVLTSVAAPEFATPNNAATNFIGFDGKLGKHYFWIPKGMYTQVTLFKTTAAAGANMLFTFDFHRWVSPGNEVPMTNINKAFDALSNLRIEVNTTKGGWYRTDNWLVSAIDPTKPTGVVSIINAVVGWFVGDMTDPKLMEFSTVLPACQPPEWNSSIVPFSNVRVNAAAALITNVTQVLSKEGTVLAARMFPEQYYWDPITAKIGTRCAAEKYFGALENGLYTFTSPTMESQIYSDDVLTENVLYGPVIVVNLDTIGPANVMKFNDPNINISGSLAITVDWHLEFRTNSVLFPTCTCITPIEVNHQSQVVLGTMPNFFENPLHLSMITAMAIKAARMVVNFVRGGGPEYVQSTYTTGRKFLQNNMRQATMVKPRQHQSRSRSNSRGSRSSRKVVRIKKPKRKNKNKKP